ncbi:MAG: Rieske (2Fe-2S) protein [Acidimicrobiales bacterium]
MWLDVGGLDEVTRRRKFAVTHDGGAIAVIAHEGRVFALDNTCIHRKRELARGVVLRDRIVCPGHQWAFDLATGYEAVKGECQPIYDVRVVDGRVEGDLDSRRTTEIDRPCPGTEDSAEGSTARTGTLGR